MLEIIKPQLATLAASVPPTDDWLHETKWDGYRLIAVLENQKIRLLTRNGLDWTHKFPLLTKELSALSKEAELILDGEIVVLDEKGISSFQLLQDSIQDNVQIQSSSAISIRYYVFDLLYLQAENLRKKPLIERKKLLKVLFKKWKKSHPHILNTEYIIGNGESIYKAACQHGLEGIISKKLDSTYESQRTKLWLKNKCTNRQEFVIGGFTQPAGSRTNFGALILGYYNTKKQLIYAGRLGTGFNQKTLKSIHNLLLPIAQKDTTFYNIHKIVPAWELNKMSWVLPKYICEVEFTEWTKDGCLRHPSFKGLRMDKKATDVKKEEKTKNIVTDNKATSPKNISSSVILTHPDKKIPLIGLSKKNLADYYELVCDSMLAYAKDRPLLMLRCPTGQKTGFYQKHHVKAFPKYIHPILIPNDDNPYCYINDLEGILSLVQFNTLEIHVWNSNNQHLSKPDKIIFDLDPGPGVDWNGIKKAAFIVQNEMSKLKLTSFVKLSGKKGLHIIIPFKPKYEYAEVKEFSKIIANYLANKYVEIFTDTVTKSKRHNKIFIDYLRNGEGATTVAAYSTRASLYGPISLPVSWQALKTIPSADAFKLKDVLNDKKILTKSQLAWKDFYTCKQSLNKIVFNKLKV